LGSDAYLEAWEWRDLEPREGSASAVADAVEAELIAQHGPAQSQPSR
jgi:hypothetical protein